jgi:hypothetical protein
LFFCSETSKENKTSENEIYRKKGKQQENIIIFTLALSKKKSVLLFIEGRRRHAPALLHPSASISVDTGDAALATGQASPR